jgi:hypothetical protein
MIPPESADPPTGLTRLDAPGESGAIHLTSLIKTTPGFATRANTA